MRLIDADALAKKLTDWSTGTVEPIDWSDIAEAPTIDVDRPHGEWVPFKYGDERWHKCTVCGVADRYIEYVERPNGTLGRLVAIRNFCPNCGAKMDGEREGE